MLNNVGVVVIGRNEGQRLRLCLASVCSQVEEVMYVDSASTDGSAELAEAMGVPVLRLVDGRFTASRGRQAGMETMLQRRPNLQYVQFLDGDCVLEAGWLPAATPYLDGHPRVGGVSGRRREERCEELFYSRLLDIDWDLAPGDAPHVGGDSLMRVESLAQVGGWSTELIAGEDPDISFRMRDLGWKIARLGLPMTVHDANMTRFREYWRRAIRSGHAYAEVGWRHRHGSGWSWLKHTLGIVAYGAVLPVAGILCAFLFWPASLLVILIYVRMLAVMISFCRRKGSTWRLSIAYAALNLVCKFASFVGVARYWVGRASGREGRLIEYKHNPLARPETTGSTLDQ